MDITAVLQAFIKGSSDRANVAATRSGSLLTTAYGLPYAKWVAEGKGYSVIEATATAGVAALPTTTAGVTLQNGDEIAAPLVLSGADPKATLVDLLEPGWLDPELRWRVATPSRTPQATA